MYENCLFSVVVQFDRVLKCTHHFLFVSAFVPEFDLAAVFSSHSVLLLDTLGLVLIRRLFLMTKVIGCSDVPIILLINLLRANFLSDFYPLDRIRPLLLSDFIILILKHLFFGQDFTLCEGVLLQIILLYSDNGLLIEYSGHVLYETLQLFYFQRVCQASPK